MNDFGLLAAQVRAARALLGWSQSYLADGIRVSRSTIADLEAARRQPHEATLFVLMSELAAAGIEFTERGVSFREYPAKPYEPLGLRGKAEPSEPATS